MSRDHEFKGANVIRPWDGLVEITLGEATVDQLAADILGAFAAGYLGLPAPSLVPPDAEQEQDPGEGEHGSGHGGA